LDNVLDKKEEIHDREKNEQWSKSTDAGGCFFLKGGSFKMNCLHKCLPDVISSQREI